MNLNKNKTLDYNVVKQPGLNGKDLLNDNTLIKINNIICFSHLRWNFVFQRPQHLLTRWAKDSRVFYFEEPIIGNFDTNFLKTVYSKNLNLTIITPHIKDACQEKEINLYLKESVHEIIKWYNITDYLLWYLTPMAVEFTDDLHPKCVVYDSMDELSCFKGAHPNMVKNENILFSMADVVFTGGHNLYEFKKNRHHNIHPIPSSIDQAHFESGLGSDDPADQAGIPHPRVGFFGVLDERLDIELVDKIALQMPEVHFVMVGPIVKIDPAMLPRHENIHYLRQKSYEELPFYLAHWDVAFLPFAKNDSTRFISPTKIPEYLAAGKPVVSTSIRDVIMPYGEMGMVEIADSVNDFSSAIYRLLEREDNHGWEMMVKDHLKKNSWDLTWLKMRNIIYKTLEVEEDILTTTTFKKKINHFSFGSE
ncbi:MAG TPA: glycosyltransferase [Prolixibacteraceae bacterium]|nr:glycosyltransferase [Prolixibacteraceae bacterium]